MTLIPKDDGIGADVRKDDGVYSTYFTDFCGEGRYGANVRLELLQNIMQLVFIQKITHHSVQNNFIPEDSDGRTGQRHWARLIIVNDQYYHLVYPNIMQKITTM